jgi:dinuclear metal center YbgI/SA1388 family protein
MKIKEFTTFLESIAPLGLQEHYDNCGLLTGHGEQEVTGILLSLDCTEAVIDEAIANRCNLIIAHHPVIFSAIKKLNGKNYVERTIIKAVKHDIAIYAIHTNLDNIARGVNAIIAEKLGLGQLQILSPKKQMLRKLITFCPESHAEKVRNALFEAGAGHIGNYSECSFSSKGTGTFKGNEESNPTLGERGKIEFADEIKIEVLLPFHLENKVISAMKAAHPYEEVAYDLIPLENYWQEVGSGAMGFLPEAMDEVAFLKHVKNSLKTNVIRHTRLMGKLIKKVAVCGGSGSFLLPHAIAAGADCFITADFKYHQFFDADGNILIADIGHYESEQFTPEVIYRLLRQKFPTFAPLFSKINTNPVNYF